MLLDDVRRRGEQFLVGRHATHPACDVVRVRLVDDGNPGVGAAGVQHARLGDVVDEIAVTSEKSCVLDARYPLACVARRDGVDGGVGHVITLLGL